MNRSRSQTQEEDANTRRSDLRVNIDIVEVNPRDRGPSVSIDVWVFGVRKTAVLTVMPGASD